MIGGIATKALVLVVGLGAGLGAGEIGSMYNYDETIAAHNQGNKIFEKVELSTISQEAGKGIKVGSEKLNIGGWEDKVRIGGKAKGGGQVGENDVDIIFTQNKLIKTDNGSNGDSGNQSTGKTSQGLSNRHVCILLGKNVANGWTPPKSTNGVQHQNTNGGSQDYTCWNFSEEVTKIGKDQKRYEIQAKGGAESKVFLDSTKDPRLGVLELDPKTSKVKKALGRKGWILGLKVDNPEKWCKVSYKNGNATWRGNSLNSPNNKRNKENMEKIGFDFLSQYVMVWYEEGGKMTTGWGNGNGQSSNGNKKKYMEVINCYKV
ncbi:hypothetical protein MSUIS_06690 [Mycoplasma suis KI3806]|uniref:Uncharacterized protein n=1 Tax=Mycoplasma suis (strain KI_3806) TaxID=708248 RepID=F0V281_MYCS3|nr:hypothetical protein [Mycoplasma suis]CBZ40762.1 hypothetical protein MSUIS_06690 [Mycoplasma suis KI3806]